MKKFFIIVFIILGLVIASIIIIPQIFKEEITQVVKEEINNSVNAKIDFADVSISLLRNFPNLYFSLNDLSVITDGDVVLAIIKKFELEIDLMSLVSGDNIVISKINILSPEINAIVNPDGSANWDIVPATDEIEEVPEPSSESKMVISLNEFTISNASIVYLDQDFDMAMRIFGADMFINGDMTESISDLMISMKADEFNFIYEEIAYMSSVYVDFVGGINMDIDEFEFTFLENKLKLNNFPISFNGKFGMPGDDMVMDLTFITPDGDIKDLLSLVPVVYENDFKDLKTGGKIEFDGFVKGIYNDVTLPSFDVTLYIDNAFLQYPDLPSRVNIESIVFNTNGDGIIDNTIVNLESFNGAIEDAWIKANMQIITPESNPFVSGSILSGIDFGKISKALPIEDMEIIGNLEAGIDFEGGLSDVEDSKYDNIKVDGELSLKNFLLKTEDMPDAGVKSMDMNFTSNEVNLFLVDGSLGESDFSLKGSLKNFVPYIMDEKTIKGSLDVSSEYLNIDELMGDEAAEEVVEADTTEMAAIEIPTNIDFTMSCNLKSIVYDSLNLTNSKGKLIVKDGILEFKGFKTSVLGGDILMEGFYNSNLPDIEMNLDIERIDLASTYESFVTIQKLAPIAKYTNGEISAKLNLEAQLNSKMEPVLNTINSAGRFESDEIGIVNMKVFETISEKLKMSAFKNPVLRDLNVNYRMKDGNIEVDPFNVKIGNHEAVVSGTQNIDKSINYKISTVLPLKEVKDLVSSLTSAIPGSLGDGNIDLDILVTGAIDKPEIKIVPGSVVGNIKEAVIENVKEKVEDKIDKEKQNLKAEAQKRADKIMFEASKQAEAIKSSAKQAANRIISEGDKQANTIIKAAESKSFIEKKLASQAAEKIKKEAKVNAEKLTKEADAKAKEVIEKAELEKQNILNAV